MYDAALIEHGFDATGRDIPVARLLAIAPTDEEARVVAEAGAAWTLGGYAKPIASAMTGERDPVTRYVEDVIIWGSPERVADQLLEFEAEKQLGYLLCSPLSQQTFTLFNEAVLPRIQ